MQMYGMMSMFKIAEETGEELKSHDFELWAEPTDDSARRERGAAAYVQIHGVASPLATTPFQGRARLDYLYGEIWGRQNTSPAATAALSVSAARHRQRLTRK